MTVFINMFTNILHWKTNLATFPCFIYMLLYITLVLQDVCVFGIHLELWNKSNNTFNSEKMGICGDRRRLDPVL